MKGEPLSSGLISISGIANTIDATLLVDAKRIAKLSSETPQKLTVLTITLDTNILWELWHRRNEVEAIEKLMELNRIGVVELGITARVHEDIPSDPASTRLRAEFESGLSELPSVTRLGYWVLGRDRLGADGFDARFKEATAKAAGRLPKGKRGGPPDWRDWDHLHGHYLEGRDYFVTLDQGILVIAQELRTWFGIEVRRPAEIIELIGTHSLE